MLFLLSINYTKTIITVSKGQYISKAIFLETSLSPKWTKYLTKFCPSFIGQNFVKYFVRFWGNGVSRKIAFQIYWPLLATLLNIALLMYNTHSHCVTGCLNIYKSWIYLFIVLLKSSEIPLQCAFCIQKEAKASKNVFPFFQFFANWISYLMP